MNLSPKETDDEILVSLVTHQNERYYMVNRLMRFNCRICEYADENLEKVEAHVKEEMAKIRTL